MLHIQAWLARADEVVKRGKDDYLADELLQDAGDSLMMKLGEAPNRLVTARCFGSRRGRVGALAIANRNFIIHSWDELNRDQTWLTLSVDLPAWRESLFETFDDAERAVDAADAGSSWAEESPIPTSGRKSRQTIARSGELL